MFILNKKVQVLGVIFMGIFSILKKTRRGEECLDHTKKYFIQNYSYKKIRLLILKKFYYNISERTLKRILQVSGLHRKNLHESCLPEIIVALDLELKSSGRNLGYRQLKQKFEKVYDLIVKYSIVMRFVRVLDPKGVASRRRRRLHRR